MPALLGDLVAERARAQLMAPLLRELDERRMRSLIRDWQDELEGRDVAWLAQRGATLEPTTAGFVVRIGDHACPVEAGPGAAVLIDGMPFVPEPQHFTFTTYHRARERIALWARSAGRL